MINRPNPWVRVPAAVAVALALVAGGLYLATHATNINDKARMLAEANVRDVLLTVSGKDAEVIPATARVAARDVAFQDDSGCELAAEVVTMGNSVAEAQNNAQITIDSHFVGVSAEIRAEYGWGFAIIRGFEERTGTGVNDVRWIPAPYFALVEVIHCAQPEPSGPPGMGS